MATIAIRIPRGMDTKKAKALFLDAVERKLPLPCALPAKTEKAYIALNAVQSASAMKLAPGFVLGEGVSLLIAAAAASPINDSAPAVSVDYLAALVDAGVINHRGGQSEAKASMLAALRGRGVLMQEAATGSGKTMAQLCAAAEFMHERDNERVVIAVPTLNLMKQIEREYETLSKVPGLAPPPIAYIVGMQRFVSTFKIESLLQDVLFAHLEQDVRQWLAHEGARTGQTISDLPYQADRFAAAFPDFPPVGLDSDCHLDDPGMKAYRAQGENACRSAILVITHARLGYDTRKRRFEAMSAAKDKKERECAPTDMEKGTIQYYRDLYEQAKADGETRPWHEYFAELLSEMPSVGFIPSYTRLIVDEGDALEQSFSAISTDDISLYELTRNHSLSEERRKKILRIFNSMVELGKKSDDDRLLLNNYIEQNMGKNEVYALKLLRELLEILSSARKKDIRAKRAQQALEYMEKNLCRHSFAAIVDFSPSYRYPRIRVGEKSVSNVLEFLWQNIKSAVVVSATLAIPQRGAWTMSHVSKIIRAPNPKTNIIHAPEWLVNPVTLYMPDTPANPPKTGVRAWLQPPVQPKVKANTPEWIAYQNAMNEWIGEVVDAMEQTLDTAKGGTLVLLSSYDLVERLANRLDGIANDRLVCATRDVNTTMQRERFIRLYEQGCRPVWLTVGGAWRGLDLVDNRYGRDDAHKDLLLTDLIIPRLPIGMNQTLSHARRKEYSDPWLTECNETMMYIKQGIGRLVRREGIIGCRRLYLLDSRAISGGSYAMLRGGIDMITAGYRKKKLVKN